MKKYDFRKKVWKEPFWTIFLLIIFNVAVVELNAFFNLLLNNRIILLFDKNCHFHPKMKNNGQTKTINILKIRKIINFWSISKKILLRSLSNQSKPSISLSCWRDYNLWFIQIWVILYDSYSMTHTSANWCFTSWRELLEATVFLCNNL